MTAFVRPFFISSTAISGVPYAYLLDGTTGYWSKTLTTSATHSGSIWIIRTKLGAVDPILDGHIYFNASNQLVVNGLTSTAVYEDTTSALHVFWNASGADVNGVSVTGTGTYATASITNPRWGFNGTNYSGMYFTEHAFWDGTSETLNGGETDATTGNWIPKSPASPDYTRTDWTENGTITQVTSTPTNVFWTFNTEHEDSSGTVSNGNQTVSGSVHQVGTFAMDGSVSFAWKVTDSGSGGAYGVELANAAQTETTYTATASDVLEFEFDGSNLDVRVNGGAASSVAVGLNGSFVPLCKAPCTITADFTPSDAAFKTLCTDNMPVQAGNIDDHVCVSTVSHDGTSTGFTVPWDMDVYHTYLEIKNRDTSESWFIVDTMRGITKILRGDSVAAETTDVNVISVSGTTGTLGSTLLANNYLVVSKRAGLIGSETSGTTDDGKAYSYSVNTDLGFCITLYQGSGVSGHNIPHGLGVPVDVVNCKDRDGSTYNWPGWLRSLTDGYYVAFDAPDAQSNAVAMWGAHSTMTSTLVGIGTFNSSNNILNNNHVLYSYANTQFTSAGAFVANASADGPYVTNMMSAAYGLWKNITAATNWISKNSTTGPVNTNINTLYPDLPNAEVTTGLGVNLNSNGHKILTADSSLNGSGATVAYTIHGQPNGPIENTAR